MFFGKATALYVAPICLPFYLTFSSSGTSQENLHQTSSLVAKKQNKGADGSPGILHTYSLRYTIYLLKVWYPMDGKGFPFYGVMLTYADPAHFHHHWLCRLYTFSKRYLVWGNKVTCRKCIKPNLGCNSLSEMPLCVL